MFRKLEFIFTIVNNENKCKFTGVVVTPKPNSKLAAKRKETSVSFRPSYNSLSQYVL